jgi:hydroxymethylpyrimidine pyrophosphatase-like HAD family hydrolase
MPNKDDKRCVAVDFDGTMSHYEHFTGPADLGPPIEEMVTKIKALLAEGVPVVIFTARVNPSEASPEEAMDATIAFVAIANWSKKVFGRILPITHEKSRHFTEIWDDRGRQVLTNTGVFLEELLGAATQ